MIIHTNLFFCTIVQNYNLKILCFNILQLLIVLQNLIPPN